MQLQFVYPYAQVFLGEYNYYIPEGEPLQRKRTKQAKLWPALFFLKF